MLSFCFWAARLKQFRAQQLRWMPGQLGCQSSFAPPKTKENQMVFSSYKRATPTEFQSQIHFGSWKKGQTPSIVFDSSGSILYNGF